jgi:hypothetical protein
MSRRVSAARLAKKRANWRANQRAKHLQPFEPNPKEVVTKLCVVPLFPPFYYDPNFIGSVGAGHEDIPHRLVEFTEEKYEEFLRMWDQQNWYLEIGLRELAKFFNLRDYRWFGLAGYIHQMMNKRVQISLIKKCVLADHLDVWKDFNTLLLSTGEWDEAEKVIDSLINQN